MPTLIPVPTRITAAGNKPKLIDEFVGRVNNGETPFTLPKGMWHCVEISYDGGAREQQLYVNGKQQMDATDYPANIASPFKIFKFGFNKLHGPARAVWYDDVAVGPTRPGCL